MTLLLDQRRATSAHPIADVGVDPSASYSIQNSNYNTDVASSSTASETTGVSSVSAAFGEL